MASFDAFFRPRSIAVVGASRDPAKLGHVLLRNVIEGGFAGAVYPVNPAGGEILGRAAYPSLRELPEAPDLVLLSIPNRAVPGAIRDAAARRARAAVILSSGFGEMGGEGASLQDEVRRSGLRVIGPNCMGVYHLPGRLNATYFWEIPKREGGLAFVSQSGAYGGMLFSEIRRRSIGLSTFVSIGNQADVTHADVMEALERDRAVEVVALFIEQIRDGKRFFEACRRLARRKRVVAMKVGRTTAGRRAALSHTGSMAGDYEVCRAALRQAGAFVARETEEFFDAVAAFSACPRGFAGGLGIVTISGGPCVAAADACEEADVAVPELAAETQARVRALIPEFGAPKNPVDMTPQMDPARMPDCVAAVAADPGVGALLAINVGLDKPEFAEAFARARKPVLAFLVDNPGISRRFSEAGIPVFDTPERAVRAAAMLVRRRAAAEILPAASAKALDGAKAMELLRKTGIPLCRSVRVTSAATAKRAAAKLGYPVVLKSTGAHKSDARGVFVDLRSEADVDAAYADLACRLGPVAVVQELVRGDHEVLVGARRDSTFGPVVLFGSGGIWTEQARDLAMRVCPVGRREALAMIGETKAGARLAGMRGRAKGDVEALARMIARLSAWMVKSPGIAEVDLNPVITGGARTAAVDALVVPARRDPGGIRLKIDPDGRPS
ncbi:MAG: acetate--CoA ligase family protein [Planctomycetes bacterium]|nr:acetate--CoA ligase family protein [Planctomycetota bacterium]